MRKYARRLLIAALSILFLALNSGNIQSQGVADPSKIILEVEGKADATSADGSYVHVVFRARYGIVPPQEIAPVRQHYPGEVKDGEPFMIYLKYLDGQMVEGSASGMGHPVKLYDCSKPKKVYWQGAGQGRVEDTLANLGHIQGPTPDGSVSLDVRPGAFLFAPCDTPNTDNQDWADYASGLWQDQWPAATISYSELHKLDKLDRTWTGSPALDIPGIHTTSTLHIRAVGSEEVEVILIPQEGYDKWMPIAGLSEDKPGNQLRVKVELRKKGTDQKPLWTTADKFTFQLVDTSHQPGTCLNWPPPEQTKSPADFDFKIDKDQNPDLDVKPDGQSATSKKPDLQQMSIWISSYDWGGWSKLKVLVDLSNGQPVTAYLQNKPDTTQLKIPKDDNENHIADEWEKQFKDKNPKADDDKLEYQELAQGDGLSLYEEYRGFMVAGGAHIRTDPNVPDLFVYDQDGLGTGLLDSSGLAVHIVERNQVFLETHPDPDVNNLVINFNSNNETSLGKQHAVWLKNANPGKGMMGKDFGGPGPPKTSQVVKVGMDAIKQEGYDHLYALVTISHELAHAANVWHHGDNDYRVSQIWKLKTDGTWADVPTPPECANDKPGDVCYGVAAQGGQESGVQDCIMRYEQNNLYEWKDGEYRWRKGNGFQRGGLYGDAQPSGTLYCRAVQGTGVNDRDHPPAPLAGNATNGNCEAQFCTNDIKPCWFKPVK